MKKTEVIMVGSPDKNSDIKERECFKCKRSIFFSSDSKDVKEHMRKRKIIPIFKWYCPDCAKNYY